MLKINEIFYSIQMEGQYTGTPAVFIRLAECNLLCPFCDTDFSVKQVLAEQQIFDEIKKYPCQTVIITGGEPLLQDLEELFKLLESNMYNIHLETNGTIEIPLYWPSPDYVVVSPKGRIEDIQISASDIDEVKLIVDEFTTEKEINNAVELLGSSCRISLQPCWYGQDSQRTERSISNAVELVKKIPECNLSIQGHKFIHIR